jgi:hypothetical protein
MMNVNLITRFTESVMKKDLPAQSFHRKSRRIVLDVEYSIDVIFRTVHRVMSISN